MNLKKLLILVLVIILAIALAAGATFLYFVWQETLPKLTPVAKPDETKMAEEPLFPTGEVTKPEEKPVGGPGTTTEAEQEVQKPILTPLVKLAVKPVAGFFILGSGTSTQIIFADRASGHLYAMRPSEGINPVRVSNTTIPKIYELYGGQSGQEIKIIARYLKNGQLQNFSGSLPQDQLEGKFLSSQIYSLAMAPSQDKIFYLERVGNETRGATANFDDSKKTIVFNSLFNEWLASWPEAGTIALQSKTASDIPGSLYFLDIKTQTLTKIISNVPGLTTLVSPDRKKAAYSAQWQETLVFGIYDIKEHLFGRLTFQTLADKCAWSKNGLNLYCAAPTDLPARPAGGPPAAYPEDWYGGEITTNDRFWKVSTEKERAQLLFDPQLGGFNEAIDALSLSVDADESFLIFLNKKDLSLWLLNLKGGF